MATSPPTRHERNAAENSGRAIVSDLGGGGSGGSPGRRARGCRTVDVEASTRKSDLGGTTHGGGVRPRESRKSVEARSKQQGRSWRRWNDHRRRQGLPA